MRLIDLCLLCAASLGFASCSAVAEPVAAAKAEVGKVEAASNDEKAERDIIINTVKAAIDRRDFAALGELSGHLRDSRARTPSGLSKLGVFYIAVHWNLEQGLSRETGCKARLDGFSRDWLAAAPAEPAAVLAEANYRLRKGWYYRAGGSASTVTDDGWTRFREGARSAEALLQAHRAAASRDPEFYALMADTYRALGRDFDELYQLLDEATARDPYYQRTYFLASPSFLPMWGGSPEMLDRFAHYAADRSKAGDGTSMYLRVYWNLEDCNCGEALEYVDWADLKPVARDLYQRYPVPHNARNMIELACKAGDEAEALRYMRLLHPEATGDGDFVAMIAGCRADAEDWRAEHGA